MNLERLVATLPVSRQHARQVAGNAGWLIVERLLRGIVGLGVGVALARALGSAGFGTLSYALSFVLIFNTLWQLGLSGIVVRELVRTPAARDEILGTVFALRFGGAALGLASILVAAVLLAPADAATRWSIVVLGVGTLFFAFEGVDFWFQSEVQSRYAVMARLAALAVSATATIALVVFDAPVVAMAAAASLEYVVTGLGYVVVYARAGGSLRAWKVDRGRARTLLSISWPLIVSGIFNSINLRIDQLMLGNLVGAGAVGTYAAAARLSEVWSFVPLAIATSLAPGLLRARETDRTVYQRRMQQAYDLMVWLALPLAIGVSATSGLIIDVLYGSEYAAAAPILSVHVWAGPFVFMGAVLSKWLIAEDHIRFSMVRHGAGAGVNVALNLVLIPPLGGLGSAIATLVSYAVASFGACALYRPTWTAARQMAVALASPVRLLAALPSRLRSAG